MEFRNNKWKYSTIGLLAVLAVGFSFPQAFAHVTNNLSHNVEHVLAAVAALQASVDSVQTDVNSIQSDVTDMKNSIPSDPADQSEVEEAMFSNMETGLIMSTFSNNDEINCTSDDDFLIHASVDPTGTITTILEIEYEEENGGTNSFAYEVSGPLSLTFGQEAGRFFKLNAVSGGLGGGSQAYVTAQSTQGSELSCTIT